MLKPLVLFTCVYALGGGFSLVCVFSQLTEAKLLISHELLLLQPSKQIQTAA